MISFLLFVFSCWPLVLLFGLLKQRDADSQLSEKVYTGIKNIFCAWCGMAVTLLIIISNGGKVEGFIPVPYNLIGFAILGLLVGIPVFVRMRINLRSRRRETAVEMELESLRSLAPGDFEALIAEYFKSCGYRIWLTNGGQDHGVDVLVYDGRGAKWVVQCKRYKGVVGEPVVRDLLGALLHERGTRAFLMTTGGVSQKAKEWIVDKPITVYEGENLVRLLKGEVDL